MKPLTSILFCVALLAFVANASAVTMNWSAVGNPGNANDTLPYPENFGAVGYNYNIGTYDVTASQYVEFLNAKDAGGTNTLFLYNRNMSNSTDGGISFSAGNANGSKYGVIAGRGNHPATFTSWYDSIRFANWMNNGQGSGDTETGAYTLGPLYPTSGIPGIPINPPLTHNAGAHIWLPTESEWYKAAYNIPGTSSYFQYPTSSYTTPIASVPTALPNHANYLPGGPFSLTDVGAYTGTTSPYGAFDMGGNAFQWNEALINGFSRGYRGGSFYFNNEALLRSSFRGSDDPSAVGAVSVGFRLASTPEPSTLALAALGFIGLASWRWRRKRV